MPGRKITMLPDSVIGYFSLAQDATHPAMSLYVETTRDGTPVRRETRLERVPITANLRLDAIDDHFANDATPDEPQWTDELRALYAAEGVDGSKPVIAYCRIGERSSHTWFVLKYLLGFDKVTNYDGSWTEWGNLVGAPVERGTAASAAKG